MTAHASSVTITPITIGGAIFFRCRANGDRMISTGAIAIVMPNTIARPPILPAMMDGAMNMLLEPIISR